MKQSSWLWLLRHCSRRLQICSSPWTVSSSHCTLGSSTWVWSLTSLYHSRLTLNQSPKTLFVTFKRSPDSGHHSPEWQRNSFMPSSPPTWTTAKESCSGFPAKPWTGSSMSKTLLPGFSPALGQTYQPSDTGLLSIPQHRLLLGTEPSVLRPWPSGTPSQLRSTKPLL